MFLTPSCAQNCTWCVCVLFCDLTGNSHESMFRAFFGAKTYPIQHISQGARLESLNIETLDLRSATSRFYLSD